MSLITEIDALGDNLKNILKKGTHAPDPYSSQELQNNELRKLGEELKDLRQDRDERKSYASKLYWLVLVWLTSILVIIIFQGLKIPNNRLSFQLDNAVLITLITTTTANVATFFLVVVRYLFRPKQ
jgi:hypothetical protein